MKKLLMIIVLTFMASSVLPQTAAAEMEKPQNEHKMESYEKCAECKGCEDCSKCPDKDGECTCEDCPCAKDEHKCEKCKKHKATKSAEMLGQEVHVKVNGLVCDFCARAVEKVFTKRDDVTAVKVDLDNALVIITQAEGKTIDDEIIRKLITDSGYSVVDVSRSKKD